MGFLKLSQRFYFTSVRFFFANSGRSHNSFRTLFLRFSYVFCALFMHLSYAFLTLFVRAEKCKKSAPKAYEKRTKNDAYDLCARGRRRLNHRNPVKNILVA